jgi:hypothetical protein
VREALEDDWKEARTPDDNFCWEDERQSVVSPLWGFPRVREICLGTRSPGVRRGFPGPRTRSTLLDALWSSLLLRLQSLLGRGVLGVWILITPLAGRLRGGGHTGEGLRDLSRFRIRSKGNLEQTQVDEV